MGVGAKSVLLATGKELIPIFAPQVFMKVCFGCDTKLLWLLEAEFPPLKLLLWQDFLLLSLKCHCVPYLLLGLWRCFRKLLTEHCNLRREDKDLTSTQRTG